jgi:hypothetical protein
MLKLKLDFKIELVSGLSATHLFVTGGKAYELDELNNMRTQENKNIIKGDIEIKIINKRVTILLLFAGTPNLSAKFNFSLKEKDVFDKKRDVVIKANGKGEFDEEVDLPL